MNMNMGQLMPGDVEGVGGRRGRPIGFRSGDCPLH